MPVDIYFKGETYPHYQPEEIEVVDQLEIFLQQVDMIISTEKGSLLGDPDFGVGLERYLWTNVGSKSIEQDINQQIMEYVDRDLLSLINYSVECNFIRGEIYDSIIVDILIEGEKVAGYAVTP